MKTGACESCASSYTLKAASANDSDSEGSDSSDDEDESLISSSSEQVCASCYGTISNGVCTDCSSGNFFNAATQACETCESKTATCTSCALKTGVCSACSGSFELNAAKECKCKGVIEADGSCTPCTSGYYFDATNLACPTCASKTLNCATCDLTSGVCNTCGPTFTLDDKKNCNKCYGVIHANDQTCEQCATGNFFDADTSSCAACSTKTSNCATCGLVDGQCATCQSGFYIDTDTFTCLSNPICTDDI